MAYSTSGCPACPGVAAGEVEDAEEVGWYAGEIGCDDVEVGEVGYGAGEVEVATDGMPRSPGFGDGERAGVGEEVGADDEDPYIDEDAPCASSAPLARAYSTVKSRNAVADLSSSACPMLGHVLHRTRHRVPRARAVSPGRACGRP